MKLQIKILLIVLSISFLDACKNFDSLVKNPNLPTSVPPSTILLGVLEHMNNENAWSGKQGSQSAAQFYVSTYDYYGTNNYDQSPFTKNTNNFEYVTVIQNIEQMKIEARKGASTDLNPYSAIGKFLNAYYYYLMTQKFGDIPLSQALKADANISPVYDTQKDVFIQILKLLEESNTDFSNLIEGNPKCIGAYCNSLSGDIYLGNSLSAWQKVVNSFALRVLISLSKKENDPDLNVKQKFSAIISNPLKYPIMVDLSDNVQFTFIAAYNPYPKNPTSLGRDGTRENVASAYLDLTTSLNDPRTFIAATPAPNQLSDSIYQVISGGSTTALAFTRPSHHYKAGQTVSIKKITPTGYNIDNAIILSTPSDSTFTYSVSGGLQDVNYKTVNKVNIAIGSAEKSYTDITAYIGAPAGLSMGDLGSRAQGGEYSYINALRYSADFGGSKAEPAIIIGFPEQCFNIAEGINRGWAVGDAASYYYAGIKASMNFLGITEGSSIKIGNLNGTKTYGLISNISVASYLSQPLIQYKTGTAGLIQILQQKYIAFWQNSNWEAFFNQRRTGVPIYSTGPGTGNGGKVALRWQYPVGEASSNKANYDAAVQRQYGGKDDLNGIMWILQ